MIIRKSWGDRTGKTDKGGWEFYDDHAEYNGAIVYTCDDSPGEIVLPSITSHEVIIDKECAVDLINALQTMFDMEKVDEAKAEADAEAAKVEAETESNDDDDYAENVIGRMAIDDAPPEIQDAYWGYTKE